MCLTPKLSRATWLGERLKLFRSCPTEKSTGGFPAAFFETVDPFPSTCHSPPCPCSSCNLGPPVCPHLGVWRSLADLANPVKHWPLALHLLGPCFMGCENPPKDRPIPSPQSELAPAILPPDLTPRFQRRQTQACRAPRESGFHPNTPLMWTVRQVWGPLVSSSPSKQELLPRQLSWPYSDSWNCGATGMGWDLPFHLCLSPARPSWPVTACCPGHRKGLWS